MAARSDASNDQDRAPPQSQAAKTGVMSEDGTQQKSHQRQKLTRAGVLLLRTNDGRMIVQTLHSTVWYSSVSVIQRMQMTRMPFKIGEDLNYGDWVSPDVPQIRTHATTWLLLAA